MATEVSMVNETHSGGGGLGVADREAGGSPGHKTTLEPGGSPGQPPHSPRAKASPSNGFAGDQTQATLIVTPTGGPRRLSAAELKLKGILKSKSEADMGKRVTIAQAGVQFPPQLQETESDSHIDYQGTGARKYRRRNKYMAYMYVNQAFEPEENGGKLAEVVDQVYTPRTRSGSVNVHPFGMGEEAEGEEGVVLTKHVKPTDSGKLVLWIIFAAMMIGVAGSIIFLSETYRLRVVEDESQAVNTTTTTL